VSLLALFALQRMAYTRIHVFVQHLPLTCVPSPRSGFFLYCFYGGLYTSQTWSYFLIIFDIFKLIYLSSLNIYIYIYTYVVSGTWFFIHSDCLLFDTSRVFNSGTTFFD
jgi:hypothetical protein